MRKKVTVVGGIKFSNLNFNQVLEEIKKYLKTGVYPVENKKQKKIFPLVIFTPNPEIVVYAQKDNHFKKIVNSAQINIPDGGRIVWASRLLKEPLPERISGTDLLGRLVEIATEKSIRVGLIGGGSKIAVRALECLGKKYPGLLGWAEEGPRIKTSDTRNHISDDNTINQLVKKIRETETRILFVGFGAPKQEYFIDKLRAHLSDKKATSPVVLMAVGGAFDYISGQIRRAPKWIRDLGFEWFYRLVRQPWRIKRQLALPKFIILVAKQKFSKA
jgi:N-acetylglucosaminyldiphosphoundecaprenol N-acetyl-beta-D-mannosaminyltransferase